MNPERKQISLVRLVRSWLIRRQKRKPKVWLVRVRVAFDNLWLRFYRMPRTEWTMQWAERNHARIINVKPPWRAVWKPKWSCPKPRLKNRASQTADPAGSIGKVLNRVVHQRPSATERVQARVLVWEC